MTTTAIPIDVDIVRHSLEHLTIARVINYLTYTFGAGADEILDLSEIRVKQETTPLGYAQDHIINIGAPAADAVIVFWGGPPDDEDWYRGTLLDMLIDRLFFNIASGNIGVVNRFVGACQ